MGVSCRVDTETETTKCTKRKKIQEVKYCNIQQISTFFKKTGTKKTVRQLGWRRVLLAMARKLIRGGWRSEESSPMGHGVQ